MDISHILRQIKTAVLTVTIFGTYLLCTANPDRVCVAQDTQAKAQEARRKLGIRLRSFVIGATGTLNFEPTMEGGVVRLTALGLPSPPVIMPNARAFVIYAVAPNNPTIRVGELRTDANGNGG